MGTREDECTHLGGLFITTESGNLVQCQDCGAQWIRIIRKDPSG